MIISVSVSVTILWFLNDVHFSAKIMAFDMVESLDHVLPHLYIDTV